jgi:hypothetical protein
MKRKLPYIAAMIVLLFAALAVSQSRVTRTPPVPAADSIVVTDFIPASELRAIQQYTSTTDLTVYLQAALDAACATTGSGGTVAYGSGRVYFPPGRYRTGPLVVGCDSLRIIGSGEVFYSSPRRSELYAVGNCNGTANSGIINITGKNHVTIEGFVIQGADALCDGVASKQSRYTTFKQNFVLGLSALPSREATASASTDLVTVESSSTMNIANGDRIEFRYSRISPAALPTGLAEDTGYFVRDKSGNSFKVSATAGGAAIDLTTDGTAAFYALRKVYTATLDTGSDVFTVAGHGFSAGEQVEVSSTTGRTGYPASAESVPDQTTLYVINPTTNTFQLAWTWGGAAINWTSTGSGTLKVAHSYAAFRNSGSLYEKIEHNTMSGAGYCYKSKSSDWNLPNYYGCNVCRIVENNCFSRRGISAAGHSVIHGNTFEVDLDWPARAVLDMCDPSFASNYTATGNYLELDAGGRLLVGARTCNATRANITGNQLIGSTVNDIGTRGMLLEELESGDLVSGNYIGSFERCFSMTTVSATVGEYGAANLLGNALNCTTGGFLAQNTTFAANPYGYIYSDKETAGIQLNGRLIFSTRYDTTAGITTIDLKLGSFFHFEASAPNEIATVSNKVRGHFFCVAAANGNTTLDGATFGLAGDTTLAAGKAACFVVDNNTQIRPIGL